MSLLYKRLAMAFAAFSSHLVASNTLDPKVAVYLSAAVVAVGTFWSPKSCEEQFESESRQPGKTGEK